MHRLFRLGLWVAALVLRVEAHAPPVYLPVPPFEVRGNALTDSVGRPFLLRGVSMAGLNAANLSDKDAETVRNMTPLTFRLIRQRWNANTVRLPVSIPLWQRDGRAYLERVGMAVAAAAGENLAVVLAASDDAVAGAAPPAGLPSQAAVDFWKECAAYFKDQPALIFDLFNQPSVRSVPGSDPAKRRPEDWDFWRNGGMLAGGGRAPGMQALVDAIRSSGARQVIAAQGFFDPLEFQGFTADFSLSGGNIIYETHPYFDHGLTEAEWEANFGFLQARFPVFAGEWGMPFGADRPSCRAVPGDPQAAGDLLLRMLAWLDTREISWTVADFRSGSLIEDFSEYTPTRLDRPWSCSPSDAPQPGIGTNLLLWTTGDPGGFGSLLPELVASVAGGSAGPVAPGEIIALYGQGLGPDEMVGPQWDSSGSKLTTTLAGTAVTVDGIPAPMLLANSYQVYAQVPYETAGRVTVTVQLFYKEVPSNKIKLTLADSAPEIFARGSNTDASALNQDGTVNSPSNPAARGTEIALFATGAGVSSPALATGAAAAAGSNPALPVTLEIGGKTASISYAGSAPGLVGILQVNATVPQEIGGTLPGRAAVTLRVGSGSSRAGVFIWIR